MCIRESDWSSVSKHVEQAAGQGLVVHGHVLAESDLYRVSVRVHNELAAGMAVVGEYDAERAKHLGASMTEYGIEMLEVTP